MAILARYEVHIIIELLALGKAGKVGKLTEGDDAQLLTRYLLIP